MSRAAPPHQHQAAENTSLQNLQQKYPPPPPDEGDSCPCKSGKLRQQTKEELRALPDLPNIAAARPRGGASFLNPGFPVLFPREDTRSHRAGSQRVDKSPENSMQSHGQLNTCSTRRMQSACSNSKTLPMLTVTLVKSLPSASRTAEKFALLLQKQEENHILKPGRNPCWPH